MGISRGGYCLMVAVIIAAVELGIVFTAGCPRMTLPNGRVRIRSRGRSAQFRCFRGFSRVGARMAICLKSNQWSQKTPFCVGQGCPNLDLPDIVKTTKLYRGGIIYFTCVSGYTREGPESIFCNGRNWSTEPPVCQPGVSLGCDFEKEGLCGWSQVLRTDQMDWTWHKGTTPTKDTGPQVDHTTGTGEGHYLFMESSAPSKKGHTAQLISPNYEPKDTTGLCLEFYYHMFGSNKEGDIGTLSVYAKPGIVPLKRLMTDRRVVSLFSTTGDKGDVWNMEKMEIPVFRQTFQFVFVAQKRNTWLSDIALDDIRLYNCTDDDVTTTSTSQSTTVALTSTLRDDIQSSSSASMLYQSTPGARTRSTRSTTQRLPTTTTRITTTSVPRTTTIRKPTTKLRTTSTTEETTTRRKRTTTNAPTTRRRTRRSTTTPEIITTTIAATSTAVRRTTTPPPPPPRRTTTTTAPTTTIWWRRKSTTEAATTTPRRRRTTTTSINVTPRWRRTTTMMTTSMKTIKITTREAYTRWGFSTTATTSMSRKTTYPKWSMKSTGIKTSDKKTSFYGELTTTLEPRRSRSTTMRQGTKSTMRSQNHYRTISPDPSKTTKYSLTSSTSKVAASQTPSTMRDTSDVSKSHSSVHKIDEQVTFQSETGGSFDTENNMDSENGLTTSKNAGVGKVQERANPSTSSSQQLMPLILGVVGAVVLVAIVIAVLAYKWSKRQRMKEEKEMEDQMNIITEYVETSLGH